MIAKIYRISETMQQQALIIQAFRYQIDQ
jgi:hypothetical protein